MTWRNFPRAPLLSGPTPLEAAPRLSEALGVELWIKRDDLAGPPLGGNKSRQMEFYLGEAQAQGADVVLITGAVQSNFARLAAAGAARLGMEAVVQREDRVPNRSEAYRRSGNVLLGGLLGAAAMEHPQGEDEAGADAAALGGGIDREHVDAEFAIAGEGAAEAENNQKAEKARRPGPDLL